MNSQEHAIIVAGGSGTRMESATPKQFLEIGGLPIVMHSLNRFLSYSSQIRLTLVLPQGQISIWKELCLEHQFKQSVRVVSGGDTRFDSVSNGLQVIGDEGVVAIHDGVRPFVSPQVIAAAFESAALLGSGIVAIELTDSIRRIDPDGSRAVPREQFRLVQTPQVFDIQGIKSAYQKAKNNQFTDDASVFEAAGHKIALVEGSYKNFKITNKADLIRAEALLKAER